MEQNWIVTWSASFNFMGLNIGTLTEIDDSHLPIIRPNVMDPPPIFFFLLIAHFRAIFLSPSLFVPRYRMTWAETPRKHKNKSEPRRISTVDVYSKTVLK